MFEIPNKDLKLLTVHFSNLRTFEDIVEWDSSAQRVIESLQNTIQTLIVLKSHKQAELKQLDQEKRNKSFLEKLLSGNKEYKKLEDEIQKNDGVVSQCKTFIDDIKSKIAFTPKTPEDQANLLRELRLEKKELNQRKKELNSKMREIRTAARQETVKKADSVTAVFWFGSKYRTAIRRRIRTAKENELSPHEDEKTIIERELLQIEKEILFVERFKY